MKLRFAVNQAACFRKGIDYSRSTALVDVNPADLPQEQRDLIADRLSGIDVCTLMIDDGKKSPAWRWNDSNTARESALVEAEGCEWEDLLKAVVADHERFSAENSKNS